MGPGCDCHPHTFRTQFKSRLCILPLGAWSCELPLAGGDTLLDLCWMKVSEVVLLTTAVTTLTLLPRREIRMAGP